MKYKLFFACLIVFMLSAKVFSDTYIIKDVSYEIKGMTRQYALEQKVKIDKRRIFNNEEELFDYINDLKQQLENTRNFDDFSVDFSITEKTPLEKDNEAKTLEEDSFKNEPLLVNLIISTKDSKHLLIVPYPKYDSNSGMDLKLKAKDTNFLGSMESMSSDINLEFKQDSEDKETKFKFGFNIDFDTPFKMGIINSNWSNSHTISYTIGNTTPEWNFKTGLELSLPFNKFSINFNFYQSFIRNLDYEDENINGNIVHYGDGTYFVEDFKLSMPIVLQDLKNWGKIYYTPFAELIHNWDFDGISDLNKDLKSPTIEVGQTLSTGRINWIENFRDGTNASITQSFIYNFQDYSFSPGISGELQYFKAFKYAGIATNFYAFAYLDSTKKIGSKLRGIRDEQYFSTESGFENLKACSTPAAFIINADLPIKLFRVYWEKVPLIQKISFARYFNMEFQLSPFIDIAFIKNRATDTDFSYKDGFYSGGLEAIIYPLKWKGLQVRASLGIDLGQKMPFVKGKLNQEWRDAKAYEISIGIGLHY